MRASDRLSRVAVLLGVAVVATSAGCKTPEPLRTGGTLSREDAEHLSAMAAGFQSLAKGASRHFRAGPVRQTVVEMEDAFLFVTAAGQGACLTVLAASDADLGLIAYEMAMLVTRVGQIMDAPERGHGSDAR